MSWFSSAAPVEPSAAERAGGSDVDRCDACKGWAGPFEKRRYGGVDLVLSVEPVACRQLAQAAGIWKVTR